MADLAITPGGFISDTLETAKAGLIPATVGVAGAALGLFALTPFLAPASVPMSVLGVVLARREGNLLAVALGGVGIVLALSALLRSGAFWIVFAALFGDLGAL